MNHGSAGDPERTERTGETPLESWKEIGAYLQREATTLRRWERAEGLPIRRHSHNSRSSVYAYRSEIDAWRASRQALIEQPERPLWRSLLAPPRALAFGATIALCLVMVGNGIRPQAASAQQAGGGMAARQIWTGDGVDGMGSPSPDGNYVSFTDWATGDLAVRDLATGSSRRLTNTGGWEASGEYAGHSVISPDGRQVAYDWASSKVRDGNYEVRILPLNTQATPGATPQPRVVLRNNDETPYVSPCGWTPDGRQLLAIRSLKDGTNQLAMVSIQDGSTRVLKSLSWKYPEASLSPDGRHVAYILTGGGNARDIFVLAADGSGETVVAERAGNYSPVWSPDGSQIVFLSERTGKNSLWSVPVEGGRAKGPAVLVKEDTGHFAPLGMTRNGALYYYSGGNRNNIYIACR